MLCHVSPFEIYVMKGAVRKCFSCWSRASRLAARVSFRSYVANVGSIRTISFPFNVVGGDHITVGEQFASGPGLRLEAWERHNGILYSPTIVIGNDVAFGWSCHVGAIGALVIGNKCIIGSGVLITDHNHGDISSSIVQAIKEAPLTTKGQVHIGDEVWIGDNVCILSGVKIGRGAVVGANAVVTRDVPAGMVVGGIPAKKIGQRPL